MQLQLMARGQEPCEPISLSLSVSLARSLLAHKALARLAGSLPRRSTLSRSGSQIIKNQNHFLSMLTNFLWLDIEQAYVKRKKSREEPAVTCGHRGAKGINEDQVVEGEATMAGVSGNSRFPWFPGIQASNFCSLPVAFCNFPSLPGKFWPGIKTGNTIIICSFAGGWSRQENKSNLDFNLAFYMIPRISRDYRDYEPQISHSLPVAFSNSRTLPVKRECDFQFPFPESLSRSPQHHERTQCEGGGGWG